MRGPPSEISHRWRGSYSINIGIWCEQNWLLATRTCDRLNASYTSPETQWLSPYIGAANCIFWTRKHERQDNKQNTSGMCTPRPRNVQLPLRPRTLLITDVTRLQPFTVGGDNFRENIETLVSYNVRTDGIQQDCLYIEQGHLMTPTTFMTYSMAIDPCHPS